MNVSYDQYNFVYSKCLTYRELVIFRITRPFSSTSGGSFEKYADRYMMYDYIRLVRCVELIFSRSESQIGSVKHMNYEMRVGTGSVYWK